MRAWATLIVLTACYAPHILAGSPCPEGSCPSGFLCSPATMTCELAPVDASGGSDAPTSGDGGIGVCTTPIFNDTFSGMAADPFWTVNAGSGMTISEGSGVVRVQFVNAPADRAASYSTTMLHDFRGGCAVFEIATIPAGSDRFAFARVGSGTEYIQFRIEEGNVKAEKRKAGSDIPLGAAMFNATLHRFLRIRNLGPAFFLETSSAATGPFTLLGNTDKSGIDDSQFMPISLGAATDTLPAGGPTTAEWSSFTLLGP